MTVEALGLHPPWETATAPTRSVDGGSTLAKGMGTTGGMPMVSSPTALLPGSTEWMLMEEPRGPPAFVSWILVGVRGQVERQIRRQVRAKKRGKKQEERR